MKKTRCLANLSLLAIFIVVFSGCNNIDGANEPYYDLTLTRPYHTSHLDYDEYYYESNFKIQENIASSSAVQSYNYEALAPSAPQSYYVLPTPQNDGNMSVEEALASRRSRRNFQDKALSMEQLSQILWAAYGITLPMPDRSGGGFRTTPSAGATFPLEVYVAVGNVYGLSPGIFQYNSENHTLIRLSNNDIRQELSNAALGQRMVANAPATIFYTAVMPRITERYGERGIRYAYMELGHSAQNVYLQAEALGLGTVAIGAFDDNMVRAIFSLASGEYPLYLMPIGYFY